MVPKGWKISTLGEVCNGDLQTGPFGSQLHSHEYVESGVAVLMPKDLRDCKADVETAAKISEPRARELEKHRLRKGDLLFSRRGDVARFALVDEKSEGSICGTGCLRARPSQCHSPEFLSYFLQKDSVKKWLEQNAVGQTMPNMNTEILRELPLMTASSRAEEEKIAGILSTWDKAIFTTEQLLANSQQQKKALMQQLLTGKKRMLDKNGVRFHEEWKLTPIGKMGKVVSGGTPDTNMKEYWSGNILWLTPSDVTSLTSRFVNKTERTISELGLKNSSATLLPKGSLMVCTRATIGSLAISSSEICTNQGFKNLIPSKNFDVEFVYYKLSFCSKEMFRKASGSTFLELSKNDFEKIQLLCPALEEQKKIAAVLAAADHELSIIKHRLAELKREKKALMQQILTGKRRVKLDEIEAV